MDDVKQTKQKGMVPMSLFVIVIILFIVVLGVVFHKNYLGKGNSDIDKKPIEEKEEQKSEVNAIKFLSGMYADSAITVVLNKGEVYISFEPCPVSVVNDDGMYAEFCLSIKNLLKSYKEYNFETFEYESLNPALSYRYEKEMASKFLGLKLNISNVKSVYSIVPGQAITPASQGLVMIKNDGSIALISFENLVNGNLIPKTVEDLTNIVKVENKIGNNGSIAVAIDKEGKEYSLYDYFK